MTNQDDTNDDAGGMSAEALADELDRLRQLLRRAQPLHVLQAVEAVHIAAAAEVADRHHRRVLAWVLRRFEVSLRRHGWRPSSADR